MTAPPPSRTSCARCCRSNVAAAVVSEGQERLPGRWRRWAHPNAQIFRRQNAAVADDNEVGGCRLRSVLNARKPGRHRGLQSAAYPHGKRHGSAVRTGRRIARRGMAKAAAAGTGSPQAGTAVSRSATASATASATMSPAAARAPMAGAPDLIAPTDPIICRFQPRESLASTLASPRPASKPHPVRTLGLALLHVHDLSHALLHDLSHALLALPRPPSGAAVRVVPLRRPLRRFAGQLAPTRSVHVTALVLIASAKTHARTFSPNQRAAPSSPPSPRLH